MLRRQRSAQPLGDGTAKPSAAFPIRVIEGRGNAGILSRAIRIDDAGPEDGFWGLSRDPLLCGCDAFHDKGESTAGPWTSASG